MPVGPTELILVLVIVVIVFGVGKLPEVGGALGKGIKEFRSATKDEEPAAKPKESSEKEA
jgi:sec-independent protein translocase protein TatA